VLNYPQFKVDLRGQDENIHKSSICLDNKQPVHSEDFRIVKIMINFKVLKIKNTKEVEFVEIRCEPELTVNNLLRKAITMLFKRFDKKL
jgi:hypothetical protein